MEILYKLLQMTIVKDQAEIGLNSLKVQMQKQKSYSGLRKKTGKKILLRAKVLLKKKSKK